MQTEEFKALLEKYENGTASANEKAFVEGWYAQLRNGEEEYSLKDKAGDANELWAILRPDNHPKLPRPLWQRLTVAASILIAICAGVFILLNQINKPGYTNDIAPYTATAILKSGGKTVLLDQAADGQIAQSQVTKSAGGVLSYRSLKNTGRTVYDTIQIPAGGKPYTVVLADGSKIILNTATVLRYPQTFSKSRKEEIELISGEIYAIVTHHSAAPLKILAPGQIITDVGTEFDIAAYTDDPDARTTLVKGAVKVAAADEEQTLSPGQQTILTAKHLSVTTANISQITAWKDGLFRFNGEKIDVIMRQLARWYNIEVAYEGKMTDEVFYGVVDRKRNISEVLRILERSQKVNFKIKGRKVTVWSK